MQGRVELMRARRKRRRQRIIITSVVVAVVLTGALLLWRPWEDDETAELVDDGGDNTEVIPPDNGGPTTGNGGDGGEESAEVGEAEGEGPTDPAELRFLLWNAGGGERAVRNAEFELSQLTGQAAEELNREVKRPAFDTRLPSAVYYHGQAPLLASFSASLADRLDGGTARKVDLTIVLGADIRSLLGNTPAELDSTALDGLTAEVLNGCGINGVAGETSNLLERLGVSVLNPRNYEHFDLAETRLYYSPGSFEAAYELKELLGLPGKVSPIPYDIQVILGD